MTILKHQIHTAFVGFDLNKIHEIKTLIHSEELTPWQIIIQSHQFNEQLGNQLKPPPSLMLILIEEESELDQMIPVLSDHFKNSVPIILIKNPSLITTCHQYQLRNIFILQEPLTQYFTPIIFYLFVNSILQKEVFESPFLLQSGEFMQKMTALGEMATGIAHEINTPLSTILLNSEYLLEDLEKLKKGDLIKIDQSIEMVSLIKKTSERIQKIIKVLKSFQIQKNKINIETVNPEHLIHECLEVVNQKINQLNIQVEFRKSLNTDSKLECDINQIYQVILNLINNACDAIEKLDERWIAIDLIETATFFKFKFTDSGKGIPPDIARRIMMPFFTTKIGKGTGLGLSLSKKFVNNHNGELRYDNSSENTCFTIILPKKSLKKERALP